MICHGISLLFCLHVGTVASTAFAAVSSRLRGRRLPCVHRRAKPASLVEEAQQPVVKTRNFRPLKDKYGEKANIPRKPREHANPLAALHLSPIDLPEDWVSQVFANASQPVILDVGCAFGGWALQMAQKEPGVNFLGIELRGPPVEKALDRKDASGLTNLAYLKVNTLVDFDSILRDLSSDGCGVTYVTVQFPDPHFKKSHKKRRVVNRSFVGSCAVHLKEGAHVFLQSDILEVAEDMREHFRSAGPLFRDSRASVEDWMEGEANPFGVPTERERGRIENEEPIYRCVFERTSEPFRETWTEEEEDVMEFRLKRLKAKRETKGGEKAAARKEDNKWQTKQERTTESDLGNL
uniref:tRNA (guanine(46)-N(7))-methyltransferase n=1 Tax=Chromera velia CCMP2878 TaxID=1169474 RepID=A0A0G4HX35_9ALVE|mmetsp:Transcript_24318/g.47742  ORF Transcript_24318/g.47742 Transcript_24318/m.47742 type:complete len:351 (-) Transcript_24318:22-1074(-)|eukprot:Cvel_9179.t1-p1 / transcript=Cvel_9179.t1 / gene=Cvel_9179 / organism=Chromera_velia_CCMP2878 / gene_product=tRNA (guanine-N(7)-)-methyltransferase, putative / transcript_product=tRNA (guanine-N(7)-)-methyltransferase, putative / location=Cvel_scaffold523:10501-11550(+) / protein_length=350 / sequence_SO=supercontig / SO=protein_coding / is_pseudo=false